MSSFILPLVNIIGMTWRNIAVRNKIPTKYQQNIETYKPFVNCLSSLVFGWLSDFIPFRFLYSVVAFLSAFSGILFSFTFQSPILFTIIILINSMANIALGAIRLPHIMKVYGMKHYIEINALIAISSIIISPIISVFMFVFDSKYAKDNKISDNNNKISLFDSSNRPYFILLTICGCLAFITGILSCFEPEDKFIVNITESESEKDSKEKES